MRFVFVFVAGVTVGYTLHNRKDRTIDEVAGGVADFLEHRVVGTIRNGTLRNVVQSV